MKKLSAVLVLVFSMQTLANERYLGINYKNKKETIAFKCLGDDNSEQTIKNLKQWCPEVVPVHVKGKLKKDLKLKEKELIEEGRSIFIDESYSFSERTGLYNGDAFVFIPNHKNGFQFPFFRKLNMKVRKVMFQKQGGRRAKSRLDRVGDGKPFNTAFEGVSDLYADGSGWTMIAMWVFLPAAPIAAGLTGVALAVDLVTLPVSLTFDFVNLFKKARDKKDLILPSGLHDGPTESVNVRRLKKREKRNMSYNSYVTKVINSKSVPGLHGRITIKVSEEAFLELKKELF